MVNEPVHVKVYLSHIRTTNAQASLRIRTVSPEPLLFALTIQRSTEGFIQRARDLAPLDSCACVTGYRYIIHLYTALQYKPAFMATW